MVDFDWGFLKNSAIIANPLKGDEPIYMDAKTFHGAFANSLSEEEAARAFEATATHDSRNILRDCMGEDGRIDLDAPHAPLLLIGGEEDEIIPAHLTEKNHRAYKDEGSVAEFVSFLAGATSSATSPAGKRSRRRRSSSSSATASVTDLAPAALNRCDLTGEGLSR
jgi:pimeloyl-ACP methyl ester carboxylesterase